jgi:hypothetical protein
MSDFVTINLAIQGERITPIDIPVGSTLEDVRILKNLPGDMEFRINGETIDEDYRFFTEDGGPYLIGTRDAKGGR